MPDRADIPRPTVKRLSLYLREIEQRLAAGCRTISSRELGASLGITDTQVRKDLSHFGQIGRSGVGYQSVQLIHAMRRLLGLDRTWKAVLIGAGNIGRALLAYPQFVERGFHIVAAFDQDPSLAGTAAEGVPIHELDSLLDFIADHDVQIGILAVPAEAAQGVAELLVEAGIQGILNFAPTRLLVPVGVISVDLSRSLEMLAYQISSGDIGQVEME
jgi:redox-sensing transcriptional repressor